MGVLTLHREHEGIDGDRRLAWPPGHEAVGRSVALGREEAYRVWAVPLVDLTKDCGVAPDVSVFLLPAICSYIHLARAMDRNEEDLCLPGWHHDAAHRPAIPSNAASK